MIDRELAASSPYRVALGSLALGAAIVLWTLVRAIRLDAVPDAPPPAFASATGLPERSSAPATSIGAAVEKDLFAPDRSAPPERYRVPGEADPSAVVVVEAPKPIVLGTAVSGTGGSFATCQLPDGQPIIVRVGDRIGEYTVKTIERGRVVFTTAKGTQFEVPALKPGT